MQERVRKDLDSVAGMSALALQQALTAAEEAGSSAAINMSLTEDESALAALRRMCASAAAATALGAADGSDAFSRKRHAIKLVRAFHLDVVVSRLRRPQQQRVALHRKCRAQRPRCDSAIRFPPPLTLIRSLCWKSTSEYRPTICGSRKKPQRTRKGIWRCSPRCVLL